MSDKPTVTDPASVQTPEQGQSASDIDEAALKAHPLYQELERQKDAAEQKATSAEGRLKQVAERLSDKPKETPKAEDSELDWKIENSPRVQLVKEEYLAELTRLKNSGAKETNDIRTIALERAEHKKGIQNDTSDHVRQAQMSAAPGTLSRTKETPVALTEHDKRFGLTAERKQKLQEKYPELKEEV